MTTDAKSASLRELYLQANRLKGEGERESFLDKACENQPQLRSRLERLLAARRQDPGEELLEKAAASMEIDKDCLRGNFLAGDFLDSGDRSPEETCALEGKSASGLTFPSGELESSLDISDHPMIGHFKLLEEIGHGGMGTVYMAKQVEPVRRDVALKVIKPGMDSREVVVRFEAERQALAMMDHPNIAKVFDGGTTDRGRPYFVMELVRGVTLTDFCKQKKLSLRDRLGLFVDVCKAVQHAHQKGIIHRDLKPSNLLVAMHDHVPVVKVIDFGVAKALNQELTDKTLFTQFAQMIGTPLYMAPEQAQMSGLDIDTRSDIYSLGVILYELLTGTTPFDRDTMSKLGADGFRKLLIEKDPERPSLRISTLKAQNQTTIEDQRQLDTEDIAKHLKRELDWIVMKALEKDRERRYETANAFAADVQRYLDDEPVEACPPSLKYRFRKHAIRNRQLLTIGAIVFVSLFAATGASSWFAIEAQVARKKAIGERNVSQQSYSIASDGMNRLLTQFSTSRLGRIPEMGDIREQIMNDASELFTQLIELDPTNSNAYLQRGKAFESLQLYELALKDYQIATSLDPRNGEAHSRLAGIYNSCPDMSFRDYDRALEHSNKAIEIDPTSVDYRVLRAFIVGLRFDYEQSLPLFEEAAQLDDSRASIYEARADVHADNKRPDRALRDADYGLSLTQPQGIKPSFGVDYTTTGELYRHQGRALTQLGRFDEAIESFNRAIEVDPYGMYAYANRLELFLKTKRYEDAIDDADIALRLQPDFHYIYKRRALAKFQLARYSEALEDLRAAAQKSPSDYHAFYYIPLSLVAACPDEAFTRGLLKLADEAVEFNDGSLKSHAARFLILAVLGHLERAQIDIAEILQRGDRAALIAKVPWLISNTGDSREPFLKSFVVWTASLLPHALKDYGRAIELAKATVENDPDNAQNLGGLGAILMRAGKHDEAKEQLEKALEASDADNTSPSYTRYFLAMTEHHLGNAAAAQEQLAIANEPANQELIDSPPWNHRMTLRLLREEAESLIQSQPARVKWMER